VVVVCELARVRPPAVWLHWSTDGVMTLGGAVKGGPVVRLCVHGAVDGLCHAVPWNEALWCWRFFFRCQNILYCCAVSEPIRLSVMLPWFWERIGGIKDWLSQNLCFDSPAAFPLSSGGPKCCRTQLESNCSSVVSMLSLIGLIYLLCRESSLSVLADNVGKVPAHSLSTLTSHLCLSRLNHWPLCYLEDKQSY